MKINWGTGIVIGFVLFISFIMFMVVTMLTDKDYKHDLVTEEYYKAELVYQDEIDAEQNAQSLSENISIRNSKEGITVAFPKNLDHSNIKGNVSFYRPSNKKLDFDFPIDLSNNKLLIPDNRLLEGRWDIKVDWTYEGAHYLFKDKTTY
ncbi:MAG: cytochrome C oxidase Cbb3 [Flavobacterium sp.]|nr:MAG: cytochrome C oxidase Cbb3 [Flavobacterium sp.]